VAGLLSERGGTAPTTGSKKQEDPDPLRALLKTLYEDAPMRFTSVSLLLLLDLEWQPSFPPSLRTTILVCLGATLNSEHGTIWLDWALVTEEHLAETEGAVSWC
jgi:hypothetical protein